MNIITYDSPPDALALESEEVTLPRTPARHFFTSIKFRRWHLQCGGFCSYRDCDPHPKNLAFQHEVTNLNPTLTPTLIPTLGEREGRGGASALSINFALQPMTEHDDH